MARLPLNKATLMRKKRELATYRQFLPSLELKRKQLLSARNQAESELAALEESERALTARIGRDLPMLSNRRIRLEGLVRVAGVDLGAGNVAGVRLPTLEAVHLETEPYGLLTRPHWVDRAVAHWREALRLRLAIRVQRERLRLIRAALTTVTQRVNLFDKVLIPRTRSEIARIDIALQEAERAGVIRAKVAKRKTRASAETGTRP